MKLKPCPLCGSEPMYTTMSDIDGWRWCNKDGCIIKGVMMHQDQWNTRPIEDKLQAENQRLKELMDEVHCKYYTAIQHLTGQRNWLGAEIAKGGEK